MHMIKKLQRKFVMITMISLLAVLLLVVGGINGLNIYQITGKSDILLEMLAENGGSFPKQWDKGSHPPGMTEETVPKDPEGQTGKDGSRRKPLRNRRIRGYAEEAVCLAIGCQRRHHLRHDIFP